MYSITFDPSLGESGMYIVANHHSEVVGEFVWLIEAIAFCNRNNYLYFVVG